MVDRSLNTQFDMVMADWRPFHDAGCFVEWRRREHNRVADFAANATMDDGQNFSYRNHELMHAIQAGNANILTFSDGGYRPREKVSAGAWVSYVLGGHWGSESTDVHLLAAEGIVIDNPTSAFFAELVAAGSAFAFLRQIGG